METVPNFLVIGAMRSGTTWLDGVLRSHPEIYLPSRRKELHFFDQYYDRGLEWYKDFFKAIPKPNVKKIGEITPSYLFSPEVPHRIQKILPDCKLIVVLRNPAERAYSHYGFHLKNHAEKRDFETFVEQETEVFEKGLYGEQLQRYLQYFSIDQILILLYEDISANTLGMLKDIAEFLSVDESLFDENSISHRANSSGFSRFPYLRYLACGVRDKLRDMDLDSVWNIAKKTGLEKVFWRNSSSIPSMPSKSRADLLSKYEEDILLLEKITGTSFKRWR